MTALINRPAPDFTAEALMHGQRGTLKLSDYRGKRVALFFYPADFSPVCPTELVALSEAREEFKSRHTEIIAASTDTIHAHGAFARLPHNEGGVQELAFPLVSDASHEISRAFGVLQPDGTAARALFLIDTDGLVQALSMNPAGVGRSIPEVLRLLDALDVVAQGEVCPANWTKGEKSLEPSHEGLKKHMAKR